MNQIKLTSLTLRCSFAKMGKRRFYGRFTPMAFSNLVFTIHLFRAESAALDIQMELDASARHATERVARLEGLHLRPIQRQIHRLLYDGQQRRELWRGHDDLYQLVRHGHGQTVSIRWLFAYAVLFRPEEYLGSIIPVGCPVYDLDRSHQPEWLVGATNSLRRIRRRHYGDLRQHERLLLLLE